MIKTKWEAMSPKNQLPPLLSVNDQGIGIQLARFGLEASTVGAAQRLNSVDKNVEIESIVGPKNDAVLDLQYLLFKRRVFKHEYGEEGDEKVNKRIDARNNLETYVYNMKITINEKDKLADKIDSEDKEKIEDALKEALDWLDENQSAEKDDFEEKLKEVEAVCSPIIKKVYEKTGGPSGGDGGDDEEDDSHEEL